MADELSDPARWKVVNNEYIHMTQAECDEIDAQVDLSDQDLSIVRSDRAGRLAASDWTQLVDASLGDHTQEEWQEYRTLLKDIPQTYSRMSEVVWPESPPEKVARLAAEAAASEEAE